MTKNKKQKNLSFGSKTKQEAAGNPNEREQEAQPEEKHQSSDSVAASDSSSTPDNLFQLFFQLVSKLGNWKTPILVSVAVLGGMFVVFSSLPDSMKKNTIEYVFDFNPDAVKGAYYPGLSVEDNYQLIDLTEWTPAKETSGEKSCKVTWDYRASVRRIREDVKFFAHRAATTGGTPKFTSETHQIKYEVAPEQRKSGPNMTRYNVLLDVEDQDLDVPFEAHLRSVRYGAFRDPHTEWAATAVVQATTQVVIEIRFPVDKPASNFRFSRSPRIDNRNYSPITPSEDRLDHSQPGRLVWKIPYPELGYAYRVDWDW